MFLKVGNALMEEEQLRE